MNRSSFFLKVFITIFVIKYLEVRDGKTFQRASNDGVNFFLAHVKYVPNFMLLCCKTELCRDFALFWVILKGFYLVSF